MKVRTRCCLRLVMAVFFILSILPPSPVAAQGNAPSQILPVDGQTARIFRDEYGVPHISAPTNRALFYAYGYAVAQDRLWQLDLFRRGARGTLAEIMGGGALNSDRYARRHGYTEAEYQDLFDALTPEAQEILTAYRDGINAYLDVVLDDRDRLPWEFYHLDYDPTPWKVTDTLAISRFMANRWGEKGGQELQNQALLQSLISAHGEITGTAMFQDLRWLNDPHAPVSVPNGGEGLARAESIPEHPTVPDVDAIAQQVASQREAAHDLWEKYGIPTKLGSYAWTVGPSRSATDHAMLLGGPQMLWDAPDIVHEVQLTGGEGFDVVGVAFAGTPMVTIGHNRSLAWTVTSGMGDNVDTYMEELHPSNPSQYRYEGDWQPMITRTETISVRGSIEPVVETISRTVHGPVIAMDEDNDLAYSIRRAHWMREDGMLSGLLGMVRADNLAQFEAGVQDHQVSNNILYADVAGNIAYWQAGAIPIRPDDRHVGRFPWSGDGSQEWQDEVRPIPRAVNPDQGYLVNWNNKASAGFDNGDALLLGKQDRVLEIEELLAAEGSISWERMAEIPIEIAAFELMGDETCYLRPYLLAAIDDEAPEDERLQEAAALLAAWDGRLAEDAVAGEEIRAEHQIWRRWLTRARLNTFGDEFGMDWTETNINTLIHALDGEASGVPPSRDYFDDVHTGPTETANEILVQSLGEALDDLENGFGTSDMEAWTEPRPNIAFIHSLGLHLGEIPLSNRATYAQVIELSQPMRALNIMPLGQSGFIDPVTGEPDPHFGDQLDLYRQFQYKPMRHISPSAWYFPLVFWDHIQRP